MTHLSEVELLRAGRDQPLSEASRSHLGRCEECREGVAEVRECERILGDPKSWDAAAPESTATDAIADALIAYRNRLEKEDADARRLLETVGDGGAEMLAILIREAPEAETAGLVRELIARSETERERTPRKALAWIEVARNVAARLGQQGLPAGAAEHLRGLAEKEYANALRVLGRYSEAFEALDRAEAWLSVGGAAEYDLAIAAFGRGILCAAVGRSEEALGFARSSAEVLAEYGDTRRAAHSRMLEALLRARRGELPRARQILEELEGPLRQDEDWATLAALSANRGNLALDERDVPGAIRFFEEAEELNRKTGQIVHLARADWQLGVVLIHAGRLDDGIARLVRARMRFQIQGMPGEVAALSLELVDAFLASKRISEARELCSSLPDDCRKLGMGQNALLALAYLRECGEAGRLSVHSTAHVREYLGRAERNPELAFIPLPG
jgi:tetratricopeptide (TPR) repeat protein